MKRAIRIDQGSLRKPERTPQGFLRVDALAARVGVLEYRNPDGSTRRELRLPEDVFRADSLAGFEGASVTDGHPTVLVDASNVRTLEAGTVTGAARRDGDWVVAPLVIKDKKLIAKIESGQTGVSVGYTIREDHTPGVHPVYGRYDLIQRDITPNHIAGAVTVPRAGDGARIRMDGISDGDCVAVSTDFEQIDRSAGMPELGGTMDKDEQIRLLTQQLAEAKSRAESAESNLKTRADEGEAVKAKLETAEGNLKAAQARLDAGAAAAEGEAVKEKQARIDELEAEIAAMRKDFPVKVRERATRVMRAQAVLGDKVRADAMDDRTLLEEGIRRFEPSVKIDKTTTDAYLQARFDSLYESRAASATSLKRASVDMAVIRTDAAKSSDPDPFDPLNNGVGQWASPHATKKGA